MPHHKLGSKETLSSKGNAKKLDGKTTLLHSLGLQRPSMDIHKSQLGQISLEQSCHPQKPLCGMARLLRKT